MNIRQMQGLLMIDALAHLMNIVDVHAFSGNVETGDLDVYIVPKCPMTYIQIQNIKL